mmetsp:Transcript_73792/g.240366  ORF Transcript_73792/g.240366 Transcript_73792/m.240366 type:complete len:95 (-) Transcript_73792:267-551(-)
MGVTSPPILGRLYQVTSDSHIGFDQVAKITERLSLSWARTCSRSSCGQRALRRRGALQLRDSLRPWLAFPVREQSALLHRRHGAGWEGQGSWPS